MVFVCENPVWSKPLDFFRLDVLWCDIIPISYFLFPRYIEQSIDLRLIHWEIAKKRWKKEEKK